MATCARKNGTRNSSTSKQRRQARRNTAADAAPQLPGISEAERRKLAQAGAAAIGS
jgi:hypothetical protein